MSDTKVHLSRTQCTLKMNNEMLVRRAIASLPVDVQAKIVEFVKAPPQKSKRLQAFMNRWSDPARPRVMARASIL